jgi:hypothetical protein
MRKISRIAIIVTCLFSVFAFYLGNAQDFDYMNEDEGTSYDARLSPSQNISIPDYTVLECEVSQLNTKELISLPAYIFFKSNEDFIIKYKINCKNDPEQITGELFYKASS